MKKIKYLHILWMDDLKFYKNLVEMINKEKIYFNKEEHYFITPFKRVYENLKEYKNVCLVEEKNMLNRYGEKASFIFLHPLSLKKRQVIRIPNKIAKKIIWRTWGHDIRPLDIKNDNIFVANIKRILNKMYVNKVHKFKAIGIADDVDRTLDDLLEAKRKDVEAHINGKYMYSKLDNAFCTYRDDNHTPLGYVKQRYTIVQNTAAFKFLIMLFGENSAIWQTAGCFGNGERIFVSAKLPQNILVKGDPVENYLVFVNSHDGSSGVRILFTPIRVICQNTLTAALRTSTNSISIRHY